MEGLFGGDKLQSSILRKLNGLVSLMAEEKVHLPNVRCRL